MTHAGFWVDGAVRKPEARHFDRNGWVIANWKDKRPDLDICRKNFDRWNEVFWLDTTPRESLTPEELYSILSLIWGGCGQLCKSGDDSWCIGQIEKGIRVDWGNLTQYPPPVEPQWVRITRDNVAQFMFRECRMMVNDLTYSGTVAGWDDEDGVCLVSCTYDAACNVTKWDTVEVQA